MPTTKSIFKYGSELGLPMGVYLFLCSFCLLFSVKVAQVVLMLFPLVLLWPVLLWMLMRRVWKAVPAYRTTGAMWLLGILTCIFGSLLCAALSGIWVSFVQPDFLKLYLEQCLQMASTTNLPADYDMMTRSIEQMLDSGHLPSSMQWVFSMIWLTSFAGAVISLMVAVCMTMRRSPNPEKFP